jgi:sugar/nucleoside kinase (ribokinase family)
VISTGSILVDVAMRVPVLPERGGDVIGDALTKAPGGGFNLAAAVARQGVRCIYAGSIGDGPNGDLIRQALQTEAVTYSSPPVVGVDSGSCFTFIEPDGERTFITVPGAEAMSQATQLAAIRLHSSDVVSVSGYDLAYTQSRDALTDWIEQLSPGITVALDIGPLLEAIPGRLLRRALLRCDILTLNRREARLLSGVNRTGAALLQSAAAELAPKPDRIVVLREGADGCYATGGPLRSTITHIRAIRVNAIDTTGAGDAHTGVLLAELAHGADLLDALASANKAAAITVTRAGAATAPTRAEAAAFADG